MLFVRNFPNKKEIITNILLRLRISAYASDYALAKKQLFGNPTRSWLGEGRGGEEWRVDRLVPFPGECTNIPSCFTGLSSSGVG